MMAMVGGGEYNREIADWVSQRIPNCHRGFDNATAIGVVDGEAIIAGVVYTNWSPEAGVIELSAAADSAKWLTRPVIRQMFDYPFEQLGCQAVVLRVSEKNKRMTSIARRFGFSSHVIPRLRGKDEAEIIFVLTIEKWRQLKEKYHG